jgi:CubicO group peptidase (beta-lactamase class C family)
VLGAERVDGRRRLHDQPVGGRKALLGDIGAERLPCVFFLDLDVPIGDYVSDWGDGKGELTVAQLVSGSSGMIGIVDDLLYMPYLCQVDTMMTLEDCARAIYTADDQADLIEPDTEFHYGGAPWQLAGGIAEAVSGKSWAELVTETYDEPCDVPSLRYTNASALASVAVGPDGTLDIAGVSYPEMLDPSALPVTDNPSIEGGVFVNAEDYGKLLLMFLRGGTCDGTRVLSEAAVSRMQVDRILDYGGSTQEQLQTILTGADADTLEFGMQFSGYGLGWWIDRDHPGVVADPGAFGADAYLDVARGYGAFIAVEGKVLHSVQMGAAVQPALEAVFDAFAGAESSR